eukprot:TRINITY_DN7710_c0_g1::TRINITY_DN7710_c0_g1_i1::g.18508::m.18508 TRINITY_DN7710_c0_g1::TRINITY_DN7710_c0_g1_i1::g.18508  ORF type:complete len:167 (+),score=44.84,sp/Q9FPJ5/LRR1_ARATH/43.30/2e-19,LRR_4/PF12799.2/0.00032,LRR_4/PF12799.2/5.7e-06,LRR_4/PF12799.2/6.7e-06,LRR_1/PF00560.28/2.9,LRR_1/PF00560.28/1.1,LRR_1/PF00560.28/0.66,LRR_1/PF00560.28/5.2,LRR_8/PF13855.1/0.0089,LRR_8/PF13855.1/5e-07,LRR_6/PF13516.1/1.2e+03,LRR_6/PF13516.1/50,LRR_6/PF13516.1/4,LRR_6/PF13516.1/1.1e+02,LRR_7/PF13504.1/8.
MLHKLLAILPLFASALAIHQDPDHKVLEILYDSTNGDEWTNSAGWMSASEHCTWHGIQCNHEGRVQGLYLSMNELEGTIPPEIGSLEALESLHFAGNRLEGTIPEEMGKLVNLKTLFVGGNQLTGTVPASIAKLHKLVFVNFSGNNVTNVPVMGKKGKKKHDAAEL